MTFFSSILNSRSNGHIIAVFLGALASFGISAALILGLPVLLPLMIVGGLIAVLLSFRSPFLLLVFLLIVRMSLDYSAQYFSFTLFDVTLTLSQILGSGIAFLGIILLVMYRKQAATFPLNFPFWLILFWGIATLTYSVSRTDTLQELMRFFDLYALSFLAYVAVKNIEDFQNLTKGIFVSALLPLIFGIYQFVVGIGLIDENVGVPRIFGTFSHPNVFSLYLFAIVALAVLAFFSFPRENNIGTWSALILLPTIIVLLLTFARVAWVSLFVFLLFFAFYRLRVLLIPLVFFPLVLFTFSSAFHDRVMESFEPDPDSSILWRQTLWDDVISKTVLDDRTALGSGMDTAALVSESIRGTAFGPNETHNDFVKFFVDGGWVGLIVYIAYLLSIFLIILKTFFQNKKGSPLRMASAIFIMLFLTLLLASLTDNVFKNTPVQWLFFIVLGALLALAEAEKKTKKKGA